MSFATSPSDPSLFISLSDPINLILSIFFHCKEVVLSDKSNTFDLKER